MNSARTNNICEGWNNKFYNLGQHRPSIWRVVKWFEKESATVQIVIGNPPVRKAKKKFVKMQTQLRNLCRDRVSGDKSISEFLHGILELTKIIDMLEC
ncbi:hypothetical protein SNE40_004905 [Patella caerulea]|uniref:Uncharacterized protein n=1 Tax=Patella caerulea TaxID=87958 RepID=A0AAN8JZ06_PATCE